MTRFLRADSLYRKQSDVPNYKTVEKRSSLHDRATGRNFVLSATSFRYCTACVRNGHLAVCMMFSEAAETAEY